MRPKVVARQDNVYLVQVSEHLGQVLDLDERVLQSPLPLDSLLARGYWESFTMSDVALNRLLFQIGDHLESTRQLEELELKYVDTALR